MNNSQDQSKGFLFGRQAGVFLLAVLAGLVVFLAVAVGASADLRFCPPGVGAGQCSGSEQPYGTASVATDFETERVYVADRGNDRIDVFEADGTFLFAFGWNVNATFPEEKLQTCTALTGCQQGSAGTGDGQFSKPRYVAVNNDPASPSHHDVYVFDSGNLRVQRFDPTGVFLNKTGVEGTGPDQFKDEIDLITVAPSGKVYVSDMPEFAKHPRVEVFDDELGFLEEFELAHQGRLNAGLAVDSTGAIYAVFDGPNGIFKFHPGGSEFGAPYPLDQLAQHDETKGLAIGAQDQLFVAQSERRVGKAGSAFPVMTVYKPTGGYLERFGYGLGFGNANAFGTFSGIAVVHSGGGLRSGDVFAGLRSGANRVAYVPLPSPGPVIAPFSLEAPEVGNTEATVAAELNPEGSEPTKYHFEYVDQHSYETEEGFKSPNTKQTAEVTVPIKSGSPAEEEKDLFSLHAAEAQVGCTNPVVEIGEGKCLTPQTEYRYRIVASNPEGEAEPVEGVFKTREALEIKETWASEPTTDGARLNARVDPFGIPTSGYFEYVDQESYETDGFAGARQVPDVAHGQSPLDFGAGGASVRGVNVEGLTPGVSYRFRLVATDALLEGASILGPERVVRPFVKPVAQSSCPNDQFRTGAGALLPDCRAYEMVSPLDKNNGDIQPLGEFTYNVPAALNESAVSGEKVSYTSYRAFGDSESAPLSAEYIAQRGEKEWESHSIDPPREKSVVPAPSQVNTEFKLFSPDLCQVWQRTLSEPQLTAEAVAGYSNIYRRTDQACGGAPDYEAVTTVQPPNERSEPYADLELQGVSADGSVAIYVASDNLAAGVPSQPASCISESEGCELRLYEKRSGQAPQFVCFLPGGEPVAPCQAAAGVFADGKGLDANMHNAISSDGERIYWNAASKVYVRVGGAQTLAVSAAGEALSGTTSSLFLAASADGSKAVFRTEKEGGNVADLYEFDALSETTTLIAHKTVGFTGLSEDGHRVYFASSEVLTSEPNSVGGKATLGDPNLYLYEGGVVRFVATLASGDLRKAYSPVQFQGEGATLFTLMARLSADGGRLAFISTGSPTGYDNTDLASPEACGEGHAKAVCDSEVFVYDATANEGKGRLVCVSCNPSGARPVGRDIAKRVGLPPFFAAGWIPAWENNQYASRVLSADGRRLFFESSDALVSGDSNGGVSDVYEWEEAGEGTCTQTSASYVPASSGCVDLVSSGKSSQDSVFLDADPSGKNAFFTTLSSLVPQDYGLIDVYDAREDGGLPPPPVRKVECEGEACQSAAVTPNDQTPASASFTGPGDLASSPTPGVKTKATHRSAAQLRSARLSRALKACRRAKAKRRRACEAAARKRYATSAKSGGAGS